MKCEQIVKGDALELGTARALLGEIEWREGAPETALAVEPAAAVARAREGQGEDEPAAQQPEKQRCLAERIEKAQRALVRAHSEAPAHY
eukprot:3482192-Pyramimonas_sp.AAC.1